MKECFIIMPIKSGEEYEIHLNRFQHIIKPAIEEFQLDGKQVYKAIRGDFISETGSITQSVIEKIYKSEIVLADLTTLNPNVFYELGVRHSLRQKTILIALKGTELPFDIGDLRVIYYKDQVGAEKTVIPLIQKLLKRFQKSDVNDSPIFKALPILKNKNSIEIKELIAERESLKSELKELRLKLTISENMSLSFRTKVSEFERIIDEKLKLIDNKGKDVSDEELDKLLKEREIIAVKPNFKISNIEEQPKTAFILMPFSNQFQEIYEYIKAILQKSNFKAFRADEITGGGLIIDDITNKIASSAVIIADITGSNPNVLYEVGIAQALGKNLILIAQNIEAVPFDIRSNRIIIYENSIKGMKGLDRLISKHLESL